MKRTLVTLDQALKLLEDPSFRPTCEYGPSLPPEINELGGRFVNIGAPRLENGLFVFSGECVERFFADRTG